MKDPAARPEFALVRQRKPPKKERGLRPSRTETESWDGVDRDLFEALRAMRLKIARERGVPPYVVFHDTTLRDLARRKPGSLAALRHVYGMGEKKTEDYGAMVIETINQQGAIAPE
jgi:ATP-dependent DNA helicase RecQ